MLIIDTEAALERALVRIPDPNLKRLLTTLADQLGGEVTDIARFIVVERGDPFNGVEAAVGFPLTIDGAPTWEVARRHPGGWVEIVFVLSDDGAADVLLVPTRERIEPRLRRLLQRHGALDSDHGRPTAA